MGRNKARLRLGKRTMLAIIASTAKRTGYRARIVRRDIVPRCGPLGGILTGLMKARSQHVLFLPCDMPFVSAGLLSYLLKRAEGDRAVFVANRSGVGFPFILPVAANEFVKAQIEQGEFSLQRLAKQLQAVRLKLPRRFSGELPNVNTPAKYAAARNLWRERH